MAKTVLRDELTMFQMAEAIPDLAMQFVKLQTALHNSGFHVTAHAVNAASKSLGWEATGDLERAGRAARGEDVN